ncbi:unnamed protein product [Brassica oleracea]
MPSITPTTSLRNYDVFLSFRGPDTRRNIVSFLYKELVRKNIRTFKDDKELESGRIISLELARAIEQSKLAVVVISKNYAASTWCLDELVKIMDFVNKGSLTVIPVFYKVDPCHVRRQIGEVAVQFKKHEERDHEKVLPWRQALTNLANISGYCSCEREDESKMVEDIAERISMLIRTMKTRSNESNLASTDGHMESLLYSLHLNLKKRLIDGDGIYNVSGIDHFIKEVKLGECGLSYAVVSIMGPQSSGKSTLLNSLFGTNFMEMDAFKGRSQTTKGIWLARCAGIEPCTLVMDLEGTDGRERGEDDTAFEKQSALFALAISDIVLINMWCHDIGREQAANKPLLKTVFQVMMRLFSPRKTTMLFVIRDKTRTPLENLEPVLREDIQKIWDSVPKPEAHKETPMSDFFNVEVVALSSYEEKEEQFKEQVASLRQRFMHSIAPGGLAGDRRGVIPASGFAFSADQIWRVIKENKDLDLPAHKVMVATVRCEEIANEKFSHFISNEDWRKLDEEVQAGPVSNFGKRLTSILGSCLSEYDGEATFFDEGVRSLKRHQLQEKLLQLVNPAFQDVLGHIRFGMLEKFKASFDKALEIGEGFSSASSTWFKSCMAQFDEECAGAIVEQADWDTAKVRDKLVRDIEAHISSVRTSKLSELTSQYESKLHGALSEPVEALLEGANDETWRTVKKLHRRETESAVSGFSSALACFDIEEEMRDKMVKSLQEHSRGVIESKAKEEAGRVLMRMKERFGTIFSHDSDSMPRVWTGKEDIRAITKAARSASLKLLSVMVVIRLGDETDNIEKTLTVALLDPTTSKKSITASDPLASSTWDEIPSSRTLITPVQCKSIWRQFKTETEYTEANKRGSNWLPPPWAILALIILGFNEFMTLLRNPLYLGLLFVVFLLLKALWTQLDIPGEFRNGVVPGLISISAKFVPTVMNLLKNLAAEGQAPPAANPENRRPSNNTSSNASSSEHPPEHKSSSKTD